jgi:hypothetical protein
VPRFFWAAVCLERGPLSLMNNLRSYLEEIVAAPCLENRSYGRRDSLRWPRDILYSLKLALASLIGGDRSIGLKPRSFLELICCLDLCDIVLDLICGFCQFSFFCDSLPRMLPPILGLVFHWLIVTDCITEIMWCSSCSFCFVYHCFVEGRCLWGGDVPMERGFTMTVVVPY